MLLNNSLQLKQKKLFLTQAGKMAYSKEEYMNAIRRAKDAGDMDSARSLSKKAAILFPEGPNQTIPDAPKPKPKLSLEEMEFGVSQSDIDKQISESKAREVEQAVSKTISEFPGKVAERTERILGEDKIDSPMGIKKGLVAGSQAIRTGAELVFDPLGILIPNAVKEGLENTWNEIKDTKMVRIASEALASGFDTYSKWADNNPEQAETFESVVDIATVISPSSRFEMAGPAEKAKQKIKKITREEKKERTSEILGPDGVLKPGEKGYLGRYEDQGGILGKIKYIPTKKEQKTIDVLTDTDAFNPNDTLVKSYNVITDEINKENNKLITFLKQSGNPKYELDPFILTLDGDIRIKFLEDPEFFQLTREGQKKAQEYLNKAITFVQNNKADSLGLLKARREFDEFVNATGSSGKAVLDPAVENAKGAAGRYVRNILNEKLKQIAGREMIDESFDRMHHLLNARYTLGVKRAGELDNRIKRLYGRISKMANLPSTPLALYATISVPASAAVATVGGVGALGALGVSAATLGTVLTVGNKKTRLKFYAKLLSGINKGIKTYKDSTIIKELKADKAYIVYLMDQARQEKQEEAVVAP